MKILFVGTNVPVPPNNGQAIRTLSVLQALVAAGHVLDFVGFVGKSAPETLEPLSSFCRKVELLPQHWANVSAQSNYLRRAQCLFSRKSYSIQRFLSQQMETTIQARLDASEFDLIVSNGLYGLVNVPSTRLPIVLDCHNVEYLMIERYAALEKNPAKKCYARIESRLMRAAERRACCRVAAAMVCSEQDRGRLQDFCPDVPLAVVPNVVDTEFFVPSDDETGDHGRSPQLLFQGSMDWYPNRDAVEFFASKIFPLVRAKVPDGRFIVAGRNPDPGFLRKYANCQWMEFTGTVPDMRPYLSAASVVVVPLRVGSGTRIKILEAGASGRPTVSTTVGAEGIDLENGKEIILADDPLEFAERVIALLQDREFRKTIGQAARAAIAQRYNLGVMRQGIENVLGTVKAGRSSFLAGVGV